MESESLVRLLIQVCLIISILYVSAVSLLALLEQRIIFLPPSRFPATQVHEVGPDVQDLQIPIDNATYIHAWWIPGQRPAAPVLLFFNGNAGVLERDAKTQIELMRQTGASLLLVDYRGYGTSSRFRTSEASTRQDAQAAFQYLIQVRGIQPKRIVIFGWSIGSGVATQLALDAPDAGGLILLSPITSVSDVANHASWLFRYVFRPAQWLRHDNDFSNKTKIGRVHMPLLLMAGSEDTLAPPGMAKQLYERANNPKTLYVLQGAGHTDAMTHTPDVFVAQLNRFLSLLT